MSSRTWIMALVVVGAAGWLGRGAFSEDEKPAGGPSPAEMEKMAALAKPGEMHAWLAKFDGTWDVAATWLCPDGKNSQEKGTATFKMLLGGRFSQQTYSGTMQGQPFEGVGLMGYDNAKKQFSNYWFDTMGTGNSVATGARSDDGKTLTLAGTWDMQDGPTPFKFVTTWVDDKSFNFKILTGPGDMAVGDMTYTRK